MNNPSRDATRAPIGRELTFAEPDRSRQGLDVGAGVTPTISGPPQKAVVDVASVRVELYPHIPELGHGNGIRDKHGHELEFPFALLQPRRDGKPRGIVKLRHGE